MSTLKAGDEDLHYEDGTHRGLCSDPNATDEARQVWSDRVRAHIAEHRATLATRMTTWRPEKTGTDTC